MYVGGRAPLHLQEDFCGTALLSVEWVHGDARRTAVGLDLDVEALNWCTENNFNGIGADVGSNVLQPFESKLVNFNEVMQNMTLEDKEGDSMAGTVTSSKSLKDIELPARDIVCAFNYSFCCLHSCKELILYFKHALNALSKKGGIFVIDLYGGTSSEGVLRMQRRFPNFTYFWEPAEFDIIQRKTRISLHFNLHKQHRKIKMHLATAGDYGPCLKSRTVRKKPDSGQFTSGFAICQIAIKSGVRMGYPWDGI